MYSRTETLLTLRDGDPCDAATLARLRAASGTAHAVAQLERMRAALRALPELDPPAGAWALVESRLAQGEAAAHGVGRRPLVAPSAPLFARAVGSAAVVAIAVIAVVFATQSFEPAAAPERRAASAVEGRGSGSMPRSEMPIDQPEVLGDTLRGTDSEGLERVVVLPRDDVASTDGGTPPDALENGTPRDALETAASVQLDQDVMTLQLLQTDLEVLRFRFSGRYPRVRALERRIDDIKARLVASGAIDPSDPRLEGPRALFRETPELALPDASERRTQTDSAFPGRGVGTLFPEGGFPPGSSSPRAASEPTSGQGAEQAPGPASGPAPEPASETTRPSPPRPAPRPRPEQQIH